MCTLHGWLVSYIFVEQNINEAIFILSFKKKKKKGEQMPVYLNLMEKRKGA